MFMCASRWTLQSDRTPANTTVLISKGERLRDALCECVIF